MPLIDLQLQEEIKSKSKLMPVWCIVKNYMELHFTNKIIVFTDGSKNPENGRTGAAVYIPQCEENIKKRTTDYLSVYTVELVAIILGLQWIERRNKNNVVVASDSSSALISIGYGKSCRLDILNEVYQIILRLHNNGTNVSFVWVPAHVGVKGNEEVDLLAKQSLKFQTIDLQVKLSKAEDKTVHAQNLWQEYWDINDTGRQFYNIQSKVGVGREMCKNWREETVITRLRIGHTGLNKTLHLIGKHTNGLCTQCNQPESVKHIIIECHTYENKRIILKEVFEKYKLKFTLGNILGKGKLMYS